MSYIRLLIDSRTITSTERGCDCCPGLSPDLQSMEQIRRIMRPTDVPDQGLLCDLLWSDPDKDVIGWGENDRGVSFTFGPEIVTKFLQKHDLDLVCRAHQVRLTCTTPTVCSSCYPPQLDIHYQLTASSAL